MGAAVVEICCAEANDTSFKAAVHASANRSIVLLAILKAQDPVNAFQYPNYALPTSNPPPARLDNTGVRMSVSVFVHMLKPANFHFYGTMICASVQHTATHDLPNFRIIQFLN